MTPRPIHPFPARMASSIPWSELQSSTPLRVLDPMLGSGTTVAVARALGHRATGFDLDPLAVLLSQAWCTTPPVTGLRDAARAVLASAAERAPQLRGVDAFPKRADRETRGFVRYWFDLTNRRQLRALADEIELQRDTTIRRLLWVAFSRLIITKEAGVSRARDLAHSRPHRVEKTPIRPLSQFNLELEKVFSCLRRTPGSRAGRVHIKRADARNICDLRSESIDVVITSPPYLNAIDYLRTSKFSLVWMGYQIGALRLIRSNSVGSEVSGGVDKDALAHVARGMGSVGRLPTRQRLLLTRFLVDMDQVIAEIARVLVPGGRAILVVADCAIRGIRVRNSIGIVALARRHGLDSQHHTRRPIPASRRYLPPPSSGGLDLKDRMRTEVVLRFAKPTAVA